MLTFFHVRENLGRVFTYVRLNQLDSVSNKNGSIDPMALTECTCFMGDAIDDTLRLAKDMTFVHMDGPA